MIDPRRSLPCFPPRSTSLIPPPPSKDPPIHPPGQYLMPQMDGGERGEGGCVLFWASVGIFARQCVVLRKKERQNKHYLKNHCVGGGSRGNGEGGWGLTSKDQKSNTSRSKWLSQANYPFGNSSDTSSCSFLSLKGSISHDLAVCSHNGNQNRASSSAFDQHEISVLMF